MKNSFISYNEYFGQFTLDNLIARKRAMSSTQWKQWVDSLHEYEFNCIAHILYMDPTIRTRYDTIRLSK